MAKVLKVAALVVGAAALVLTGTIFVAGAVAGGSLAAGGAALGAGFGLEVAGISVTAGGLLTGAAVLSTIGTLLTKKPKLGGSDTGGTQIDFQADPNSGIPYVIGRTGTGGKLMLRYVHGDKNEYLVQAVGLSGAAPVEEIEATYVDNIKLSFPTGDQVTSGTNLDDSDNPRFNEKLWIRNYVGGDPGPYTYPPAIPDGEFTVWDSDHVANGYALSWMTAYGDQKAFPSGFGKPLWVLKGAKVYDPRQDSTYPGGSGSQRVGDRTTWVYSENPYIHGITWCLGQTSNGKRVLGLGAASHLIDLPRFVEAANVADANAWKIGGVVYSSDSKWSVLEAMLKGGSGKPMRLGAKISCVVDCPRVSLKTITGADVVGHVSIVGTQGRRDRFNSIIPRFRSEADAWEMVPGTMVKVGTYITEDGEVRSKEVEYTLCQDKDQAAQLAAYDICNSREFGPITAPLKAHYLGYVPGDCLTIDEPELCLNNQKVICLGRTVGLDGGVSMIFRSETDGKHDFALGRTDVAPPTPGLSGGNPGDIPLPDVDSWQIISGELRTGNQVIPAIVITGEVDTPNVTNVIFDYKVLAGGDWSTEEYPASIVRAEIKAVRPTTTYTVQVRYRTVLGVEDQAHGRSLGNNTTGTMYADGADNLGGLTADYVNAAIQSMLDLIALVEEELATANAALEEAQNIAAEQEILAMAVIEQALNSLDQQLAIDARTYIDNVPIGVFANETRTITANSAEILNVITARDDTGTSYIVHGDLVKMGDGQYVAEHLTALGAEIDGISSTLTLSYVTQTSLTSTIAALTATLTSNFNGAIATAVSNLVTISDLNNTIAAFHLTLNSERDTAIATATSSLVTSAGLTSALSSFNTTITSQYQSYVASAITNFVTLTTVNSAIASYDTTIKAWVDGSSGLAATVSTTATALATATGQLYSSYTLKANANGNIASMQLLAAGGATSFSIIAFEASQILFKSGASQSVTPIIFDLTKGWIFASTITAQTANIATANIITLHLASGAVTDWIPALNVNLSQLVTTTPTLLGYAIGVTIPAANQGVAIGFYWEVSDTPSTPMTVVMELVRDGSVVVDTCALSLQSTVGGVQSGFFQPNDQPTVGSHYYSPRVYCNTGTGAVVTRIKIAPIVLKR